MPIQERIFNGLLGLSLLSWAVLGMVYAPPEARWSTVRCVIASIHVIAGVMFLCRSPLREHGSPAALVAALPSLAIGWLTMSQTAQPHAWPLHAQAVFAAGGLFTSIALLFLGRSFAILPCLRQIVARGPYRLIRHPAYAGELTMLIGCVLASPTLRVALIAAAALPTFAIRIMAEERTLASDAAYRDYKNKVRWRMVPWVW